MFSRRLFGKGLISAIGSFLIGKETQSKEVTKEENCEPLGSSEVDRICREWIELRNKTPHGKLIVRTPASFEIERIREEWMNMQRSPNNYGKLIVGMPHYTFEILEE